MRVGLVARCLNTPHLRGMGRYVQELLKQSTRGHADAAAGPAAGPGASVGATPDRVEWTLYGDDPRHPLQAPGAPNIQSDVFAFRGDRFELWEQLGLPLRVRRRPPQLLHATEGALPWWQPVPTVVTVHDTMAWQEHDGSPGARFYWNRLQPAALARCAAVITISQSSRRDILARWPGLERKLTVIPHGIDDAYLAAGAGGSAGSPAPREGGADVPWSPRARLPAVLQADLGSAPYLVYLGGPMQRKRFDWALQVLQACDEPTLHLVACGFGDVARRAGAEVLPAALRGRVHFTPFLDDAELLALYRGAAAVLYPTRYEGFGFPAVEAQAAGAPAIFSAVGSLAELVGPLAMVVDADDLGAWVAAVRAALARPGAERHRLADDARRWAGGFSWQRSYRRHLDVYRDVLAGRESAG